MCNKVVLICEEIVLFGNVIVLSFNQNYYL